MNYKIWPYRTCELTYKVVNKDPVSLIDGEVLQVQFAKFSGFCEIDGEKVEFKDVLGRVETF